MASRAERVCTYVQAQRAIVERAQENSTFSGNVDLTIYHQMMPIGRCMHGELERSVESKNREACATQSHPAIMAANQGPGAMLSICGAGGCADTHHNRALGGAGVGARSWGTPAPLQ